MQKQHEAQINCSLALHLLCAKNKLLSEKSEKKQAGTIIAKLFIFLNRSPLVPLRPVHGWDTDPTVAGKLVVVNI